jgi:hypothetical protein
MKQNDKDQKEGNPAVSYTVGISHFPEMGAKARAFFPTHNFDIIKHHREYVYKKFIVWEFANERVIKRVKTNENDFKECRNNWLKSEIKEIDQLIELPSMTRSDQIELGKYRNYLINELDSKSENTREVHSKKMKPCQSEMRARAFCILLLQQEGIEPGVVGQKELINIANKRFPDPLPGQTNLSGKTIYQEIKIKGLSLTNTVNPKYLRPNEKNTGITWIMKYKSDYDYGLKLFNELKLNKFKPR